jgi:Ca-activated chloride channel family protein
MSLHIEALLRGRTGSRSTSIISRLARLASLLSFSLLLIATFNLNTFAQDAEPPDDVVRVSTDLVTVPTFVTDERGRRVSGLTQADFLVRDAGRAVKIEYFAVGTERVALAFVLDATGSVRELIAQQRETALELFSRFGRDSRVAVLQITDQARLAAPFTIRSEEALAAFNFPAHRGRGSAIFDTAAAAVRAFTSEDKVTERRIIILISDGLDTSSNLKASMVIDEARALGVSIYVIHLPLYAPRDGSLRPRPAAKGFRDLALKTGGQYFVMGDVTDALNPRARYNLAPVFKSIGEDLQGQYVLGFYTDEAQRDARFHPIQISLTSRANRKLRVNSLRQGYTLK